MAFKQTKHQPNNIEILGRPVVSHYQFCLLRDHSNKKQQYFWHVTNTINGKILASSETYTRVTDARSTMMGFVNLYRDGVYAEERASRLQRELDKYTAYCKKIKRLAITSTISLIFLILFVFLM